MNLMPHENSRRVFSNEIKLQKSLHLRRPDSGLENFSFFCMDTGVHVVWKTGISKTCSVMVTV